MIRALQDKVYKKFKRAVITSASGNLKPGDGPLTFVAGVGRRFDQNRPDAMMTCRMGLCRAFEKEGIPYVIMDLKDLSKELSSIPNPLVCIFGADYDAIDSATVKVLRDKPLFVWVDPWFKDSETFFAGHDLDWRRWTWGDSHRKKILDSEPGFVYTATVESGLNFFEEWSNRGVEAISLPLACDTSLYNLMAHDNPDFAGIKMAFVGGYWDSKGRQIDRYLRVFEDDLVVYGYNKWPYKGYRGQLAREDEPSLYRQALLSPTINEPSVRILKGQINERVFKVLGSGGMTIVDAVPAYRELFADDELLVPSDEKDFADMVEKVMNDADFRERYAQRGYEAVLAKHTYQHRVQKILKELGLEDKLK